MNDNDLRFFLAHDKLHTDEHIDDWRDALTSTLADGYPDKTVTVIAGRDDYKSRSKDAGGWKGWPRTVVHGALWDGTPRFHGVIRPAQRVGTLDVLCGKPTYEMIEGFLQLDKNTWVWDINTHAFFVVTGVARIPGDDFKSWGRLIVQEET
tara:strand:+ start:190 stop:642 length:453 start_codon:yes stop_codon:yes gene_type:complete